MNDSQEPKEHGHTYTIVVNGQQKTVDEHKLTYDAVVTIAFPTRDPQNDYSVSYRKADDSKHDGSLASGGVVTIKDGTIFNVTPTLRS